MLLELLTVAAVILSIYLAKHFWRLIVFSRSIPGLKPKPIIGNADIFSQTRSLTDINVKINKIVDEFSEYGLTKLWYGPILAVLVWDPSYIEVIANSPHTVHKGKIYELGFGDFLNGAFIASGGPRWKELRRPVVRGITKRFLEIYFKTFVTRSKDFCDFIRNKRLGNEYSVLHDVSRLLIDTFAETHLGVQLNEVRENKWSYHENFERCLVLTVLAAFKYCLFFFKYGVKLFGPVELEKSKKALNDFYQWIFDERVRLGQQKSEGGPELYPDFLLKRGSEKGLPLSVLRKELADMVLGGSDTSTIVLSSALLFLAMFPEVQEEVLAEQERIFSDRRKEEENGELTPQDLADMEYLTMVVKETLRVIGPPAIVKAVSGDITLGKYQIPKGCYIYVSILRAHRDPRYWDRPNQFYPEHFTPEREARRPRYSYMPFGCGPRSCPGFQYAMNLVKTALSTIIRQYKLSSSMKYEDIVYEMKLMLEINQGYPVKFEERKTVDKINLET